MTSPPKARWVYVLEPLGYLGSMSFVLHAILGATRQQPDQKATASGSEDAGNGQVESVGDPESNASA